MADSHSSKASSIPTLPNPFEAQAEHVKAPARGLRQLADSYVA